MILKNTALLFIHSIGESNCCLSLDEYRNEVTDRLIDGIRQDPTAHRATTVDQVINLRDSLLEKERFAAYVHGVKCTFKSRSDARSIARWMAELDGHEVKVTETTTELPEGYFEIVTPV